MYYQTNNLIRKNKINKITVLLDNNLLSEQTNYHKYDIMCFNDFKSCFNELGLEHGFNVEYLDNHSILLQELQIQKPEFIINLVNYGYMGNEKNNYFTALFAMLDIPFMNANMAGIAITDDKNILHLLAKSVNIPSPTQITLTEQELFNKKSLPKDFPFPAFLKLRNGACSCGISTYNLVSSTYDLHFKFPFIHKEYLSHSNLQLNEWLLQEYLPGSEYNVTVIGNNNDLKIFPVVEISFHGSDNNFQTYQFKAKTLATMQDPISNKQFIAGMEEEIKNYAKILFKILRCQDYCRMEFKLDKHHIPKIIDVNPLTSYGKSDSFAIAAAKDGLNYKELWRQILLISLKRNNLALL